MSATLSEYSPNRRRFLTAVLAGSATLAFGDLVLPRPARAAGTGPFTLPPLPYADNALPVLERVNNAWLVSLAGASHAGFADQASLMRWFDNPDTVGCYFVRDRTPQASGDTSYYDRIGTVEEGVLRGMQNRLCLTDPLPAAMSPLLQHRITQLAVRSFFETVFNPDVTEQARYGDYLQTGIARDFPAVAVERSKP